MQIKQQEDNPAEGKKQLKQHLQTLVGDQVMHILGQPESLHRVQVRRLWEDRYRVNVFTGPDAGSAVVAHSFFLVTDGEGHIITATPGITKQY